MTAPLFRLPAGSLAAVRSGDTVCLDGAEGHHAARVLRLRAGNAVLLADGSGLIGQGRVRDVDAGAVRVVIEALAPATTPAEPGGPRFVLVQALVKGGRAENAIEAATELGVDEIVAWQAQRCVVVWRDDRRARALAKWTNLVDAAAKQSRRPTAPLVSGPADTPAVLARIRSAATAVVLHEEASQPLASVDLPPEGDLVVVVGPEGGLTPQEVSLMSAAGAYPVRLGPHVLRSGTAGPAALAVLGALTRWR